ncbi:MAG: DMT family transporter [Parvularculaceae bacterium]|nr:DMT family transporter [Parvularculaceae bacterium]
MSPPPQHRAGPAEASPIDWMLLAALTAIGGSSFTFIHAAIETVPPALVAIGRLWIAAGALILVMKARRQNFPPLLVRTNGRSRLNMIWRWMIAIGIVGYSIPFLIFPWAQQYVESGLAGVYMAFMPLWTLALAYFFADEKLTPAKVAGFLLGFAGVLILLGPAAISGVKTSGFLAQAGLLVATLCYAVSVVLTRRAPGASAAVLSAGVVGMGAVFATPAFFFSTFEPSQWSPESVASVIVLGLGPTALAGIIIFTVVARAGASFMALANYLTPIVAVFLGAILFHERLDFGVFAALALILAGVAISQRRPRPSARAPDAAQKSS